MKDPIIIIEDKELLKTSFFNYFSNNIYNKINDIPVINYNDKIFIVFSYKLEFQDIQKKINKINSNFKNINFLYFVSKKIKTHFEKLDNCIFFPIKLDELTSIIKKDNDGLIVYNNVELRDNILKNLTNNKLIKISDIEKEILRILFFQKSAEKQEIKVTVLNYKSDIKSNSVESHLTRIRNKIESIEANIKIVSGKKGNVLIE